MLTGGLPWKESLLMPAPEAYIRAVVLDLDDTLVGTLKPKVEQHIFVAKEHFGLDIAVEDVHAQWGRPFHDLLKDLYGVEDPLPVQEKLRLYREQFPKLQIRGARETVDKLSEMGMVLGVLTNHNRSGVEYDFESHPDLNFDDFAFVYTSDDTEHKKPDGRAFDDPLAELAEMGIEPEEVLYVGDNFETDGIAAIEAGLGFCGVETGLHCQHDFVLSGLMSLPTIGGLAGALASGHL